MGISLGSPVGMKSRLRCSVCRNVCCQGSRPGARPPGRHRAFLVGVGREDVGEAGPAEVDVHEQGSLTRPGAGGGQVERGRALALARLGAGYQ